MIDLFRIGVILGQTALYVTLLIGIVMLFLKKIHGIKIYILLLVASSSITNFFTEILAHYKVNNMYIMNIYTVVEFILLAEVYKNELKKFISIRIINYIIFSFLVFFAFNIVFIQPITELNNYVLVLESILLIIFSILYFYKTLQTLDTDELVKESMFWISAGTLFYFSATALIFLFAHYFGQYSRTFNQLVWAIHTFCLTIFIVSLFISLCLNPQPKMKY